MKTTISLICLDETHSTQPVSFLLHVIDVSEVHSQRPAKPESASWCCQRMAATGGGSPLDCGGSPQKCFEARCSSWGITGVSIEAADLLEYRLPPLTAQDSYWEKIRWYWRWLWASSIQIQGQTVKRTIKSPVGRLRASFLFFILKHGRLSFWAVGGRMWFASHLF